MTNTKVIHADDHQIVRKAIKKTLSQEAPHIQIVGEASSYPELLDILENTQTDLLLLDGVIKGGDISYYLPFIKSKYPDLKILLLWIFSGTDSLTKWIHLLDGHLSLNINGDELVTAIDTIMNGERYFALPVNRKHKKSP